jgi:hypothetical protein
VLLPGFQKGRAGISKLLIEGKGQGTCFGQKRAIASYKEKLEKWTEFHYF